MLTVVSAMLAEAKEPESQASLTQRNSNINSRSMVKVPSAHLSGNRTLHAVAARSALSEAPPKEYPTAKVNCL